MSDCAIPTSPVSTGVVYADLSLHYQDVIGTDPGLISTAVGQRIACAAEQAYWDILQCLMEWGISTAEILELFVQGSNRGQLAARFRWLTAYYWMTDTGLARDDPAFQRARRYYDDWQKICADGGTLVKPDGTVVDLSATAAAAKGRQGLHSTREGSDGITNDHRFQTTPLQFLPGRASHKAAGGKYGNTWDGGV